MDWITPRLILCISQFILCFFVLHASAEVYIWVDKKGQKHFSDRKPAQQKSHLKKFAASHSEDHEAIARQNAMNAFLAKQSKAREEQERQAKKIAKKGLKKKLACERAKRRMNHNKTVSVMYSMNDDGERVVWSDGQRLAYTRKVNQQVKSLCN